MNKSRTWWSTTVYNEISTSESRLTYKISTSESGIWVK